ncbi:unnamed protein product, partial [Pleuronectes platessa]
EKKERKELMKREEKEREELKKTEKKKKEKESEELKEREEEREELKEKEKKTSDKLKEAHGFDSRHNTVQGSTAEELKSRPLLEARRQLAGFVSLPLDQGQSHPGSSQLADQALPTNRFELDQDNPQVSLSLPYSNTKRRDYACALSRRKNQDLLL